jgi:hypothetical protein
MQLVVLLALILDVPTDHFFVTMLAYRAREISVSPKFPRPIASSSRAGIFGISPEP